eukprot:3468898-Rhodomonas_salina.1
MEGSMMIYDGLEHRPSGTRLVLRNLDTSTIRVDGSNTGGIDFGVSLVRRTGIPPDQSGHQELQQHEVPALSGTVSPYTRLAICYAVSSTDFWILWYQVFEDIPETRSVTYEPTLMGDGSEIGTEIGSGSTVMGHG